MIIRDHHDVCVVSLGGNFMCRLPKNLAKLQKKDEKLSIGDSLIVFLYYFCITKTEKNDTVMKIRLILLLSLVLCAMGMEAKKYPEIKFERVMVDLGTFCMDDPVQKCVFKFTNVGKAKLVINAVRVTCGCTSVDYPKDFIAPGGSGEIVVTYDGSGKMPGRFKKIIAIQTNSKEELTRVYIQGDMTDVPVSKKAQ